MFHGIFNLLKDIVGPIVDYTLGLISYPFYYFYGDYLGDYDFNLLLFSETPILSMSLESFLYLFFSIFYSMFFIILLYKATKKFINMIFGVFRV